MIILCTRAQAYIYCSKYKKNSRLLNCYSYHKDSLPAIHIPPDFTPDNTEYMKLYTLKSKQTPVNIHLPSKILHTPSYQAAPASLFQTKETQIGAPSLQSVF